MKSLRVGILCYPSLGGSGVIATDLGRTLAEWGHHVHIFSYATPSRLEFGSAKICVHTVDGFSYPLFKYPPYDLALASRIIEVAETEGLDIVHAHYAIPHAISAYLARESMGGHFKTVTTLHGTDITLVGAERSYFPMTKFGIEVSDAVTSVSQHLKEETVSTFSPKKKIQVIPNFVDTVHFAPPAKRESHREKIILHVSNFRPVKRIEDIVRAFEIISKKVPARLRLVGEGPEQQNVSQLVRKLKLQNKVEFLGNQPGIRDLLHQADLYMLASETESFGLSALEAMSCGVPVVVPNVGGLPEFVTHGKTGMLADEKSPASLAAGAMKVLKDAKLWNKISKQSRELAEKKFNRASIVKQYLALYHALL